MPSRDWRLRIRNILECAAKIQQYTEGLTFTDFRADSKAVDAVLRNLEVIGEAAGRVPIDIETCYPNIPWSRMRGMRNVLVHEYFGADLEIVWRTIHGNLPQLTDALQVVLEDNRDLDG